MHFENWHYSKKSLNFKVISLQLRRESLLYLITYIRNFLEEKILKKSQKSWRIFRLTQCKENHADPLNLNLMWINNPQNNCLMQILMYLRRSKFLINNSLSSTIKNTWNQHTTKTKKMSKCSLIRAKISFSTKLIWLSKSVIKSITSWKN